MEEREKKTLETSFKEEIEKARGEKELRGLPQSLERRPLGIENLDRWRKKK